MSEQKQTGIKINGKDYILETLPPKVQALLTYHATWELELKKQRLEAAKTEAALREIQREIAGEMEKVDAMIAGATAANEAE